MPRCRPIARLVYACAVIARQAGLGAALLVALAPGVRAAPQFNAPFLALSMGPSDFVRVVDLNADNHPDLVTTTQYNGTVRVALGLGGGDFAPPVTYGVSAGGSAPAIGDLTGDGVPDVAIADYPNVTVGILPGLGNGTFGDTIQVATGYQCYTVAVADFNADSKLDLAAANWTSVMILLGNGDGTFSVGASFPTASNVSFLTTGDLNGDQIPDVVCGSGDPQVSILLGIGNGALQPYFGLIASSGLGGLTVADVTGDGKPDVVARCQSAISIFAGKGNGTFDPRVDVPIAGGPGGLDVADLNGDGHPDLLAGSNGSFSYTYLNQLFVLLGDGQGGFPARSTIETAYSPNGIDAADVNGDGKPDLVAACGASGLVTLHLGSGDGIFGSGRTYTTGPEPTSIGLGDLDGDSRLDLVVAHAGSASISVRLGNGSGAFGIRRDYDYGLLTPRALALGDLDGDGRPDVAVADPATSSPVGSARVTVFSGYSGGFFASMNTYPMGFVPSAIAIGDLNGDGHQDLVVADEKANRVSVMINSGTGAFLPPVHYGAGNGPAGVAIGDLDGDTKLDVVTANRLGGSVTILFGAGNGSFSGETELPTDLDCRAVAIGFVDADAIPDLVTANGQGGSVSTLLGIGGGLFAPSIAVPVSGIPASVAIADLDGDNIADLTLGSGTVPSGGPQFVPEPNTIATMRGLGGGAFEPGLRYGCGDLPEAIAVAHIDAGGGLDIVTANREAATVSVLMHTGSTVAVPPAQGPTALVLGQSYPNPAPASLDIRFALPRDGEASLRVYDLGGRLVRTLAQGALPAGEHFARWDRRTDQGAPAASGVYFYELRTAGQRIARRLVLL